MARGLISGMNLRGTLVGRFVLEDTVRSHLGEAIFAYARREVDLSTAAHYGGISVYQMLSELQQQGVTPSTATEKFLGGLETLAETLGGSEALL